MSAEAARATRVNTTTEVRKLSKTALFKKYGVPIIATIMVAASIVVIAILMKVVLENYYFFCSKSFKFIPLEKWCDGVDDCADGQDEQQCVQPIDITTPQAFRISEAQSLLQANIALSGTWGVVCYDTFSQQKAKAVCSALGFTSDPTFSSVAVTDLGTIPTFSTVDVNSNGGLQASQAGSCQSVVSISCQSCGASARSARIIGGVSTSIKNYPWQVSLQYQGAHVCGGSVITPRWILSAAHCFPVGQRQVPRWRVQLGISTLTFMFATPVEKIYIHSLYRGRPNDIALIKLTAEITLTDSIQPVCLPGFDDNLPADVILRVSGWGHTSEGGGTLASTLQEVALSLIPQNICSAEYQGQITDTMICAGRLAGGTDTCQGDSGGALVYIAYDNTKRCVQVGIVSFGEGCGRPGKVGVYTKVQAFLYWIYGVMALQ